MKKIDVRKSEKHEEEQKWEEKQESDQEGS